MDVRLVEVFGLPGFGIAGHDCESGRVRFERVEIDRVFAVVVRQCAVDIVEPDEVMVFSEVLDACVFLAVGVFGVELVAAVGLMGDIADHVGASCGDAVAVVEVDAHFHEPVHDSGSENRPVAAADIDQCCSCHVVSLT